MAIMAGPIVRAIYLGGEFRLDDVGPTQVALVFYSVGIFAWAGQAIVARGFFAMQDTLTPVILGTIVTVIFVPLNYALMRPMGAGGLALATSIAAAVHLLLLTVRLRGRLNGLEGRRILASLTRVCGASAAMGVACVGVNWGVERVIDVQTKQGAALEVLVAMDAASVVYLALLKVLKTEELEFIWSAVRRRVSGRAGPNDSVPTDVPPPTSTGMPPE